VSQLLGSNAADYFTGKSGPAKIEGHSKFEQVLDLKPYLTEELQEKHSNMFCRLFSVIVHAGKNSHSGHYISYVRNISKNEWWKMDDARVTVVSTHEVMNAEAYMLFYRVVEHPFAIQLRNQAKKLQDDHIKETPQEPQAIIKIDSASEPTAKVDEAEVRSDTATPKSNTTSPANTKPDESGPAAANNNTSKNNPRKRKAPEFTCGEDWARAKTTLPEHLIAKFKDIEVMISEYVQFKPEFFKLLTEQASKGNAKVGHGPSSGVCEDDIVDGTDKIKRALLEIFYELNKQRGEGGSLLKKLATSAVRENEPPTSVVTSMVDPNEDTFL
jgi:hypothetical protein